MALKRTLEKAEYGALDPALKTQYREADGKYVLDVDDSGAMSALESERQARKALEAQLAAFGGQTPDQVKALADAKASAERDAALKSGNLDKIVADMTEKHQKDMALRDTREKQLRDTLQGALIDAEAVRAITEHGGNPELLLPIVKMRTRLETIGERETAVVVSDKGTAMLKAGAKSGDDIMGIGEYVGSVLKTDKRYAGAFASPAGSGTGRTNGGVKPTPEAVTRQQQMERTVAALNAGATRIGAEG